MGNMKYIIINGNSIVVYISNTEPEVTSDGFILCGGYKFIQPDLEVIGIENLPDYVRCQKYGYNKTTGEFYNISTTDTNLNIVNGSSTGSLRAVGSAEENDDYILGDYALALGQGTKAPGLSSLATGNSTSANGMYSFAGGYPKDGVPTVANGIASLSYGKGNITYGNYSVSLGCLSETGAIDIASINGRDLSEYNVGSNAASIGYDNKAIGESSLSRGSGNIAYGKNSSADGVMNTTYSYAANASGFQTEAGNPADETYGHASADQMLYIAAKAQGYQTKAIARASFAGGTGTIASADSQTALGKYNNINNNALFIVGNGTDDNHRANAFTVNNDGTVYLAKLKTNNGISANGNDSNIPSTINYSSLEIIFHEAKPVFRFLPSEMPSVSCGDVIKCIYYGNETGFTTVIDEVWPVMQPMSGTINCAFRTNAVSQSIKDDIYNRKPQDINMIITIYTKNNSLGLSDGSVGSNGTTIGSYPVVDASTLFAVGNGYRKGSTITNHNAFDVRYDGFTSIHGSAIIDDSLTVGTSIRTSNISGVTPDDAETTTLTLTAYDAYVQTTALHLENFRSESDGVRIHGVANPTAGTDAANKKYVDTAIQNAGGGSGGSGTVYAEDVYFKNDLITTTAIGNITLTNGQATIPAAGKTIKQVFDYIFVKEKTPTIIQPAVTLTSSDLKAYEVGTKVSPAYTASLSAGSYEFGPATGITASSWNVTNTDGNVLTTASGTFPGITVADDTRYSITATATYTDGTVPITNIGNSYSSGQIKAGSKKITKGTITGYRNGFYGTLTSKSGVINSTLVRSLSNASKRTPSEGNTWSLDIPVGTMRVVFAYPATLRDVSSVLDTDGLNAEIKTAFTKHIIQVYGANSYSPIDYKVYVFDFATANDESNIYKILI